MAIIKKPNHLKFKLLGQTFFKVWKINHQKLVCMEIRREVKLF